MSTFFKIIVTGFCVGLFASMPLGPAAIESVNKSVSKGFIHGFKVSIGAILADIFYLLLINLGLIAFIYTNRFYESIFFILSGMLLCLFSLEDNSFNFNFNKLQIIDSKHHDILSGFFMTICNPLTFSVWITVSGTILSPINVSGLLNTFLCIISILLGSTFWYFILNIFAFNISKRFKINFSKKSDQITKIILVIIGIYFMGIGLYKIFT